MSEENQQQPAETGATEQTAPVLETLTGGASEPVVEVGSGRVEIDEALDLETLPVYQSHKQVHAAPILEVRQDVRRLVIDTPAGPDIVDVPENFFARSVPTEGDFFVRYRDGYVSFCPKAEFIDGYTRLSNGPLRVAHDAIEALLGCVGRLRVLDRLEPDTHAKATGALADLKARLGL